MFDSAHLSSVFGGILLLATTIDADEATIILVWAIVCTESKETWPFSFELIAQSLKDFYDEEAEGLAIIFDREKGLGPTISEFFPDAWHYWCTQHLAENVDYKYSNAVEKKFRHAMQVTKRSEHAQLMNEIKELSEPT